MPVLGRRGFTLVELMVSLVLFGIVSTAIYKILVSNQRVYQAQTQRIGLQQNIRAAVAIFDGEFRELDAREGDIQAMAPNFLTVRAMRQLGFICNPPVLGAGVNGLTMTLRSTPFYGFRRFASGDSLLVFYEGDQMSRADDGWHLAKIVATPTNQPCPDATAGQQLTVNLAPFPGPPGQVNQAGAITTGSPVRGFEVVTYGVYQDSDSSWYIALVNASGTKPMIGPIIGSNGLTFTYYDTTGAVTGVAANVAHIGITVRAQTAQQVWSGGAGGAMIAKVDSFTTQVTLRNNPRF
ncbi:MAG TPA: prepilin-type N-terminal cleavage/methylation domain-containing protein [Gemmatimonadales bacterium]|nr:prepilin-type N-terminal cleavage/methylation domain-containing protein [Gemmatimonadales bacterium]